MVGNMRAYSILYFITIKCMKCMQEMTEYSSMLLRSRLISTTILGDFYLATEIKQQETTIKNLQENSQGWKKDGILLPRGDICHPMPPHSYAPVCNTTLISIPFRILLNFSIHKSKTSSKPF